jgi:hypothetical protein
MILILQKLTHTMSETPAPANAGRYPEMPSAALHAILTAQYGCVSTSGNTSLSMNAPKIVDPHHDVEAVGACFPATPSGAALAINAAANQSYCSTN